MPSAARGDEGSDAVAETPGTTPGLGFGRITSGSLGAGPPTLAPVPVELVTGVITVDVSDTMLVHPDMPTAATAAPSAKERILRASFKKPVTSELCGLPAASAIGPPPATRSLAS
jgi:hypothetical protein